MGLENLNSLRKNQCTHARALRVGESGLFRGESAYTNHVLEYTNDPLKLFYYFKPPRLWLRVALESNRYFNQHLNERVDKMYQNRCKQGDDVSREDILLREKQRHKKIKAEEVLHCSGLLVARMLCPHKRRLADHWVTTFVGAVRKGTFGRCMSKARFGRITQKLHFTENASPIAEMDRAWLVQQAYGVSEDIAVRSVVETLRPTFGNGSTHRR